MGCRRFCTKFSRLVIFNQININPSRNSSGGSKRPDLEKVTHTGQVFDKDDYRNVRFMNAKRWVNENTPMHLSHERATIKSDKRVIWCDGGGPAFGHPKFYINLDKPGLKACYYCGQTFQQKEKDEH